MLNLSYWSEITAAQTLDALLEREKIDFIQYLERMPDGYIPKKQELLDELKANMEARNKRSDACAAGRYDASEHGRNAADGPASSNDGNVTK